MVLEIPDEAVEAMHLPTAEVEAELKKELAVALYARRLLSIGKSVEWAGVTARNSNRFWRGAASNVPMTLRNWSAI